MGVSTYRVFYLDCSVSLHCACAARGPQTSSIAQSTSPQEPWLAHMGPSPVPDVANATGLAQLACGCSGPMHDEDIETIAGAVGDKRARRVNNGPDNVYHAWLARRRAHRLASAG